MSLIDTPPVVASRLSDIARFAVPVGLCALTGTTALYLPVYLASTPTLEALPYALLSSWSLWTQLAAQLFALVALAGRHRRASGVAAVALTVTPIVRDLLFFAQDGTSISLYYWAQSLTKMIPGLFLAVMLTCLVRDRGYWRSEDSRAARTTGTGEGVLWPWLLYVALPSGALQAGAAYVSLALLATPVLNPYSSLVLWVSPLAAAGLFLLTVGPGTSRRGWRIGFAAILLAQLPHTLVVTTGAATNLYYFSGTTHPGLPPAVAVVLTCGPVAVLAGALLVAGLHAARTNIGQVRA